MQMHQENLAGNVFITIMDQGTADIWGLHFQALSKGSRGDFLVGACKTIEDLNHWQLLVSTPTGPTSKLPLRRARIQHWHRAGSSSSCCHPS
mmetsp:Transcript_19499/g.47824  ORF Transcript_19499/g.47824 Transcript_19499/m.47824 type:complete len:92 (+) Transcript_19499:2634-2909(+)